MRVVGMFKPIAKPLLGAFLWLLVGFHAAADGGGTPTRAVAAVASAHPLATAAGEAILRQGGNAFDAAVAISAALAVVEPYSSGLGGGGFWLLHRARDGFEVMVDGRERAPLAAHRDLYLDERGDVRVGASVDGPLAAAIPGLPAALDHLAHRYGRLPLAQTLAPAIALAESGFPADRVYRKFALMRAEALRAGADAASVFLANGAVPAEGALIRQPDLAATLRALSVRGRAGFYAGEVAERLVRGVRDAGGIWTRRDLEEYRVIEREPVRGSYRRIRITSAPPPSSGGIVLVEMLNVLEGYRLADFDDATLLHVLAETMRRAYRDRAEYLGDADFVTVPVGRLLSKDYAAGLRQSLRLDRATPSAALAPTWSAAPAGDHTSHFSIVDAEGNRVAATLTINYPFGSGFMPPGTGVLLNNEMDDFAIKPGVPNLYGLVGAEANAIASGKRPLSSMTPTFLDAGDRFAVLGTPGGSRIISMVLLGTLAFAAGADAATVVGQPRVHHQYLPDVLQFEPGAITEDARSALRALGHALKPLEEPYGNMQAVIVSRRTGRADAASDPRGIGAATVMVLDGTEASAERIPALGK